MNIREINDVLFERCCSISDEFPEISLKGEIVDCKIFKNNVGISFKIKDEYGMFNCKCWNFKNIDIFAIRDNENSTCIVSGFIKVNYFNNHYDFVLELDKDIIKENNKSLIKSLKEECENRGYLINKKLIDWNSISKIGLISKKDTQGYNDFIKQLKVDFEIILKEIVLEGVNTEKTLIDAINEFQDEDVEAILIVRGGGSTIEISNSYDKMSIFEVIRNSNKPIITAIGHEADKDEKLLIT
jgi:exodeoxyribonuclease VII large subunit